MTTAALEQVEQLLLQLLDLLADRLSPEDRKQVDTLIDANEFGVALEWILDSLPETQTALPSAVMPLVESCARRMGVFSDVMERFPADRDSPVPSTSASKEASTDIDR